MIEPKDLVGKYVHFVDNKKVNLCELDKGLTMLCPNSLFYLKIETAEKYKSCEIVCDFILLTGVITDSAGKPQMFPNDLIDPTAHIDIKGGKADYVQPKIAHIANPDFLEHDEEDSGIIMYDFDLKENKFKKYKEKLYVPCIISRDELANIFTEKDGLPFRYFFGSPFVSLVTVFNRNNKVLSYGTSLFTNGNDSFKNNIVQLYMSKKYNIFEYGVSIAKFLGIPFYFGQKNFDKSLLN